MPLAAFAALGYAIGGFRLAGIFVFAVLLLGIGTYWLADRVVLGMSARARCASEPPPVHVMVERLATRAGVVKPKLRHREGPPLAFVAGRRSDPRASR